MKLEGLSIIGWRRGSLGGKTFFARTFATATVLPGEFQCATATEVAAGTQPAIEALADYAAWSGTRRALLLQQMA